MMNMWTRWRADDIVPGAPAAVALRAGFGLDPAPTEEVRSVADPADSRMQ